MACRRVDACAMQRHSPMHTPHCSSQPVYQLPEQHRPRCAWRTPRHVTVCRASSRHTAPAPAPSGTSVAHIMHTWTHAHPPSPRSHTQHRHYYCHGVMIAEGLCVTACAYYASHAGCIHPEGNPSAFTRCTGLWAHQTTPAIIILPCHTPDPSCTSVLQHTTVIRMHL